MFASSQHLKHIMYTHTRTYACLSHASHMLVTCWSCGVRNGRLLGQIDFTARLFYYRLFVMHVISDVVCSLFIIKLFVFILLLS